jgi:succinyl-CoA synthetase beta subunit
MNLHEYQAKSLLNKFGVAVPVGFPAFSVEEATEAAQKLSGSVYVVKAQIHAGGRGKAGGVKVVKSLADVTTAAQAILGKTLITPQTGPAGRLVRRLYVEEGCAIARELYLSFLVDRTTQRVMVIASTEGGMDIEEVAEHTPEKIVTFSVDPAAGWQPYHGRLLCKAYGLTEKFSVQSANKLFAALYDAFWGIDASLVEINPLVVKADGGLIALDAKVSIDDNALFRHPDIAAMRDEAEEDPLEVEAGKAGLNYIKLDGNIACLVNGAGLAMATMDIIQLCGGSPANFLDVGGGATKDQVTKAFRIILSDPNVEGILINIFGGIMRCDIIAEGVIAAAKEVHLDKPLVVRLEGTNVDLGKKILRESGLAVIPANDLSDAARKIVDAVRASKETAAA